VRRRLALKHQYECRERIQPTSETCDDVLGAQS
jgi:hypothetical protein